MARRRSLLTRLNFTRLEAREVPAVDFLLEFDSRLPTENQTAADFRPPTLNGEAYFILNNSVFGQELHRSNGTAAGTRPVEDLSPDGASTSFGKIVVAGGKVAFAADPAGGVIGPQLYLTDGTQEGTKLLEGFDFPGPSNPNVRISEVAGLAAAGDAVYWGGFAQNTDGSLRQTAYRTTVADKQTVNLEIPGLPLDQADDFVSVAGGVVFTASTNGVPGLFGAGTTAGSARRLVDTSVFQPFQNLVQVNDHLAATLRPKNDAFTDFELWVTNGTADGTRQIPVPTGTKLLGGLVAAGGKAYFTAGGADGAAQLWVTEGDPDNTTLLRGGLNPDAPSPTLRLPRTDGSKLYFPASDDRNLGTEMWVSDGTVEGTRMIADLAQGRVSSVELYEGTAAPIIPQPAGIAYFLANVGGPGGGGPPPNFLLHRTDGTPEGTFPVEVGPTVANLAVVSEFYVGQVGGKVLFRGGQDTSPGLWTADPTDPTAAPAADTTTTLVVKVLSIEGTNIFTATARVRVEATVTAAGHTPTGSVVFTVGGSTRPPATLDGNGTAAFEETVNILTAAPLIQAALQGNASGYAVNYQPDHPDRFNPSSVSGGRIELPPGLLTADQPSVAPVGSAFALTSAVRLNLPFALPIPLPLDQVEVRFEGVGPAGPVLLGTGRPAAGTGLVSATTPDNLAAGEYTVRAVVRAGGQTLTESPAATLTVTAAAATTTALTTLVTFDPNTQRVVARVFASVTSPGGVPDGSVLIDVGNGPVEMPLINSNTHDVVRPLESDEIVNLLLGQTPSYTATYVPGPSGQFSGSSGSGGRVFVISDVIQAEPPVVESPPAVSGQPVKLTAQVNIHPAVRGLISDLRLPLTVRFEAFRPTERDNVVVLGSRPLADGAVSLEGVLGLTPGEYYTRAVVVASDTVRLTHPAETTLTVTTAVAAADTTTTLTAVVSINLFPPSATAQVTATVTSPGASAGDILGEILFDLGNGVTDSRPVVNGTAGPVSVAVPLSLDPEDLKKLLDGTSLKLSARFVPNDPARFSGSEVKGGRVVLPSGILTIDAPTGDLGGVTTGKTVVLRSEVQVNLPLPPLPGGGSPTDGLKVWFEAVSATGLVTRLGEPAVLAGGVATASATFNLPAGGYSLRAVLLAGDTVTLGESAGTPFAVVEPPAGTGPGAPPATGRLFGSTPSTRTPTQVVWLSMGGGVALTDIGSPGSVLVLPAFSPSEFGYEADQLDAIQQILMTRLEALFEPYDIFFTFTRPDTPDHLFSTVVIGGSNNSQYSAVNPTVRADLGTLMPRFNQVRTAGTYLGIAQSVDIGNRNRGDDAVVFSQEIARYYGDPERGLSIDSLTKQMAQIIAHEVGHLMGLRHLRNDQNPLAVMMQNDPRTLGASFGDQTYLLAEGWADELTAQNSHAALLRALGPVGDGEPFVLPNDAGASVVTLTMPASAGPVYDLIVTLYGDGNYLLDSLSDQPGDQSAVTFRVPGGSTRVPLTLPKLFPNARISIMGSSRPGGPIDVFSGSPVGGVLTPAQLQVALFGPDGTLNAAIPMCSGEMGSLRSLGTAALTARDGFAASAPVEARTAFAVGSGPGAAPVVRLIDARSNREYFSLLAYEESFTGGVQAATADVNGDGMPDLIVGAGVGGAPRVRVFDGATRAVLAGPMGDFFAYEDSFRGGVQVAVGDVTGDGVPDIILGSGVGGGPRVRVMSGADGRIVHDFFAYEADFRGGVQVAAADLDGDGRAEIIAGSGFGGGPRVRVFRGTDLAELANFFAYEADFRGGVNVTAGDLDGDGRAEVIAGSGVGGGPAVRVFDALTGTDRGGRFVYEDALRTGVRVTTVRTTDAAGPARLVVSPGPGASPRVKVLDPLTGTVATDELAFDQSFLGGLYVG